MNPDYITTALSRKYADFHGRASRAEFWTFTLALVAFYLLFVGIAAVANNDSLMLLAGLPILAAIIPSLAIAVRRLHDVNLSAWWILTGLLVGLIPLILMLLPGTPGENRYGAPEARA